MENIFQLFKDFYLKVWYNMLLVLSFLLFFAAALNLLPAHWDSATIAFFALGGIFLGIGEMSNHVISHIRRIVGYDLFGNAQIQYCKISQRRDCLIGWVFNLAGFALWAYAASRLI